MQFTSTIILQVLTLVAGALALPAHGQTQTRTVADIQVFQCAPNNDGIPLFGTCCHEFRENGDCKDGANATESFDEPSGFTQFTCGDAERNAGTPACCKTIKTHGEGLIPDKAWQFCTADTVLY